MKEEAASGRRRVRASLAFQKVTPTELASGDSGLDPQRNPQLCEKRRLLSSTRSTLKLKKTGALTISLIFERVIWRLHPCSLALSAR